MSDRDRNISDEKKLLNLYIKYQRDYAGNQQFANLRGIAHENTLKVDPNAGMVPGYKFGGGEIAETFEGQIVTLVI